MGSYTLSANLLAQGLPKISAIRHLYQLPFYLLASFYLASFGSILALGYLWVMWCVTDLLMLEWLSKKHTSAGFSHLDSYRPIIVASLLFTALIVVKPSLGDNVRYVMFLASLGVLLVNIRITAKKTYIFYKSEV